VSIICQNDKINIRRMSDCVKDYMLMSKWLSNPIVLEYYEGRDNPFDLDKTIEHYGPRTRGEDYIIPCIIEYDEKAIGYVQYYRADIENPILDEYPVSEKIGNRKFINPYGIDLFIGETDYWNKGIGTIIVQLLVNYLLQNDTADIIFIDPQTWNKRAIGCYEKCGFKPIVILEKKELHEGAYRDNLIMAITNDKYI